MTPIVDDSFQSVYAHLLAALPDASLLHGKHGVGLKTIAQSLMPNEFTLLLLSPIQKTATSLPRISIEHIRMLQTDVRSHVKQIVIIDDADAMTESAQNAFLKLLEEPNSSTKFILTSHSPEQLLPTVRSRVQSYFVPFASQVSIEDLPATTKLLEADRQRVMFIAHGRPAEMTKLLHDQQYLRERSANISLAKSLLEKPLYEMIVALTKQKSDRTKQLLLIDDVVQLMTIAPKKGSMLRLQRIIEAREMIARGGNPRLQLIRAMVY